jgi:arginine-tRNA-protein transferase
MKYFYPGYFVPGYRAFDYKLDIATDYIEYLEIQTDRWLPLSVFKSENAPLTIMKERLNELKKWLLRSGIIADVMFYDYFYANQTPELSGAELFDFPVFLTAQQAMNEWTMIVFDVRYGKFLLLKCYPVLTPPAPNVVPGYYSEYVLKSEETLYASATVDQIGSAFVTFLASKAGYLPTGERGA